VQSAHYGTMEIIIIKNPCISRSHNAKNFLKIKKIKKHIKSHKKHTERGDRARHGPWHDMATTQPTNSQIDHPKKRKIYPN